MRRRLSRDLAQTQTFILAGGQGERLHPLTASRPKPIVPFGGVFRIIDFTLSNCLHSEMSRVSVLTQYKYEEIHRYVREGWHELWSASREGAPLVCLAPMSGKRYRGTADALFRNMELLHDDDSEFVLVLAGDHVYQMDYGDLLCQHVETNADLTIATIEHSLDQASQFGVVEIDESLKVTGFEEKPSKPRSMPSDPSRALVSMGVYVFKKRILVESLRHFCESGIGYDFGHHIIPALIRQGSTFAFDFRDKAEGEPHYWRDIGTIDAYHQANMDVLQPGALFDPHLNRPTRYPLVPADWPEKRNFALIDSGVHIHRSVLSPGVELESGIILEESVLMPGVRIGKGARLRRTIIEEGVAIPAGYRAGFDIESDRREHAVTENGIVVITHVPTSSKPKLLEFTTRRVPAPLSGMR